eukprot:358007-Chlamydomonas_euryale.AAC.5
MPDARRTREPVRGLQRRVSGPPKRFSLAGAATQRQAGRGSQPAPGWQGQPASSRLAGAASQRQAGMGRPLAP